ncbi:DUF3800 domain-containing protein [Mesorhizobium sp. WSM3224]|uniref:DUF3800 domain-containing protein n=1 Tax=Mesorhizobium sp. WSM3224 TaxID=1040986 RepID=UPI0003F74D0B|nr:DUF3800 domain-containing protein [Mesorhizobium sp. WSM3224]
MIEGAIYVDDSGNPGVDSGSEFLPSSRKSWTAVIVPSAIAGVVQGAMDIFLTGVREEFGAEELHFTNIYSGEGPWKSVNPHRRAEMIGIMADLMDRLSLPIVHQTVSDFTLLDHPDLVRSLEGKRVGGWNLEDISHFGLLLLCSQVSMQIRTMKDDSPQAFELPLPLYVDEGVMTAGRDRKLPNWSDVIEGPQACFRRSADVPGIQLADFAAFILTRSQWIAVNRNPGPMFGRADELILRAAARLNILNLPMRWATPGELERGNYEDWLSADRVAKGLPPRPLDGK